MSTLSFASTCCQVSATSAKQMCSSHCDRWPLLIMLIHNKGDFTFFPANNHKSLAVKLPNKIMEMKWREKYVNGIEIEGVFALFVGWQ